MGDRDLVGTLRDYLAARLEGHLLGPVEGISPRTVCPAGYRVLSVTRSDADLVIGLRPQRSSPASRTRAASERATLESASKLRIQLGRSGVVQHYRPGEAWRGGSEGAQAALAAPTGLFVAYRCAVCELSLDAPATAGAGSARDAPDAPASTSGRVSAAGLHELVGRARVVQGEHGTIASLLLDPRVLAELDNRGKSEVLHLARIWPWEQPHRVSDSQLMQLYRAAGVWLAARDVAEASPESWVFERAGARCRSCRSDVVERARMGPRLLVTYLCLTCQRPAVRP